MSSVLTRNGPAPGFRLFKGALHLVLDLDLTLDSLNQGDDGTARLENVRNCIPGVIVTLFTDQPTRPVLALFSGAGLPLPNHLLSEAGLSLHHRTATGGMVADPAYREWFDFNLESKKHSGAAKAIGLEYLEIYSGAPRPLMVVGRPGFDAPILGLADIPVLTQRTGRREEGSAVPGDQTIHLDVPGLSGVVRLLLCYVAASNGEGFIRHAEQGKPRGGPVPKQVRVVCGSRGEPGEGRGWPCSQEAQEEAVGNGKTFIPDLSNSSFGEP